MGNIALREPRHIVAFLWRRSYSPLWTRTSHFADALCDIIIIIGWKCLFCEGLRLSDMLRNWAIFDQFFVDSPGSFQQNTPSRNGPVHESVTVGHRGAQSMDKRYSTIIFVPHARAKFRKLKVSHRLLFSLISLVTSSLCLSTFFSVQYFTSLSQTHELSKLRRENRELQTANEQFSTSVESLRGQLRTVEDRTRKLAIIAGITTLDETSQGGSSGLRSE